MQNKLDPALAEGGAKNCDQEEDLPIDGTKIYRVAWVNWKGVAYQAKLIGEEQPTCQKVVYNL